MSKPMKENQDKALLKAVRGFRRGILGGGSPAFMCRAICLPLQSYLSAIFGIELLLVDGVVDCGDHEMYHTWLQLQDGRTLDPTADQFRLGLPPVYLGALPSQYEVNQ